MCFLNSWWGVGSTVSLGTTFHLSDDGFRNNFTFRFCPRLSSLNNQSCSLCRQSSFPYYFQ